MSQLAIFIVSAGVTFVLGTILIDWWAARHGL